MDGRNKSGHDKLGTSQHFGLNKNNAAADHSERPRGARRQIEHAMLAEWTAIADRHGDASAAFRIGHANPRAERERPMRGGETVAVGGIKGTKS